MSPSGRLAAAAAGLLVLDALVRLLAGDPYPGATALLVTACGVSLVPFLPRELGTSSLRVAVVPALGLGSFALLLTTVSIVGVELTELSIRLAVLALVLAAGAAGAIVAGQPGAVWWPRRELVACAVLLASFGLALASSFDIVDPFPPPGTDWAYYLLYADEVEAQGRLLAEDSYGGEAGHLYSVQPGVGALYGSLGLLDGLSDETLAKGIAVVSALAVLSLFAAVAGLWGATAGLLAAGAYAVASIRLETMYWHGLATTLALVFVPLVLLGLGLVYRGGREWRVIGLLGFSLASVAVAHSASALVVAIAIALVIAAEVVRGLIRLRSERPRDALLRWWREGVTKPVLASVAVAGILGAGTIVHLRRQAADLGSPVDADFFDREWLDLDIVDYYYAWPFLGLVAASLVLVVWGRERRRDPALAALAALVIAAVAVSQLWRIDVPFEYRRVVYYAGPVLAALVGIASVGLRRRDVWIAVSVVALVVVARDSIGLRLPERLVRGGEERSAQLDALAAFRAELDRADPSGDALLVADRCLGVRVPYAVRRRTLVSAEEWQAGYTSLVDGARDATAIVAARPGSRLLAGERGVDYVLVDPDCNPDAAARLGGEVIHAGDELIALSLRGG